jgi:DNA-binding response OmpR family regulator
MAQGIERYRLMLVRDAGFMSAAPHAFAEGALKLLEVADLKQAAEQIWLRTPDLLLVECRECIDELIDFCRALRPFFQLPILVVEDGVGEEVRITLLDSGADDVVACAISDAELLARFNALRRRVERQQRRDPHAHYLRAAGMELDIGGRRLLLPSGQHISLPLSLIKLLAILFHHYDAFVPREAIARHVFGNDSPAAQARTSALVNLLRRRIEHELGLPSIVVSVMGRGYRLVEGASSSS